MGFTIAHITDPHLAPAPLPGFADFRLKRFMGYVNWKRGREGLNDMGVLARLVEDLRAQAPIMSPRPAISSISECRPSSAAQPFG